MSEVAVVSTTLVLLNKPSDWIPWLHELKYYATQHNVWKYYDPSTTVEAPVEPVFPATPEQRTAYAADSTWIYVYNAQVKASEQATKGIGMVNNRIMSTIAAMYKGMIKPEDSPRTTLTTLRDGIGFSDESNEIYLEQRLHQLCKGPGRSDVYKWIADWRSVKVLNDSITESPYKETQIVRRFLTACRDTWPGWADERLRERRNETDQAKLTLNVFCNDLLAQIIATAPPTSIKRGAFAAKLIEDKSSSSNSRRELHSKTTATCVCGSQHPFQKCWYLNSSIRPSHFKYRDNQKARIRQAITNNPNIRKEVNDTFAQEKIPLPEWDIIMGVFNDTKTATTSSSGSKIDLGGFAVILYSAFNTNLQSTSIKNRFALDSGANVHVCHDRGRFSTFEETSEDIKVACGDGYLNVEGVGNVIIEILDRDGDPTSITLYNVAYIPGFHLNLVSIRRMKDRGIHLRTEDNTLRRDNQIVARVQEVGDFWILDCGIKFSPLASENPFVFATISAKPHQSKATAERWHRRLGHPNKQVIQHLEGRVEGAVIIPNQEQLPDVCEGCKFGYFPQIISRTPAPKGTYPFERVHMDLVFYQLGYNSDKFIFHMYCTFSHFHYAWSLADKGTKSLMNCINEAISIMDKWGFVVKYFHLDPDSALRDEVNSPFKDYTRYGGIIIERGPVGIKEPVGGAERSGGVLVMRLRSLLIESKLPTDLWPALLTHTCMILNRLPVQSMNWITPWEVVFKMKPSLAPFRIVGSKAFVKVDFKTRQNDRKVMPQSVIGFYVGFRATNIYSIWVPQQKRVVHSRDVIIDESVMFDPRIDYSGSQYTGPSLISFLEVEEIPEIEYSLAETTPEETSTLVPPAEDPNNTQSIEASNAQLLMPSTGAVNKSIGNSTTADVAQSSDSRRYPTPDSIPGSPKDHHQHHQSSSNQDKNRTEKTPSPTDQIPPRTQAENPSPDVVGGASNSASIGGEDISRSDAAPRKPRNRNKTTEEALANIGRPNPLNKRYETRAQRGKPWNAHLVMMEKQLADVNDSSPMFEIFYAQATSLLKGKHQRDLPESPKDWKSMLNHPEREGFMLAANKEWSGLMAQGTFEETIIKSGIAALPLKWVFTYKFDPNGYLTSYKARICVRGDLQVPTGEDYYAAAGALRTFRVLMALVAAFNLICWQMDAITAFINASIEEEVYVQYPPGFGRDGMFIKLRRALYGLKRSPQLWFNEIHATMVELGYNSCPDEPCLFVHSTKPIYVFIYVDDFLLIAPETFWEELTHVKESLKSKYAFKDMGDISQFLNITITRDRKARKLWLSQEAYMEKLIVKFDVNIDRPVHTPLSANWNNIANENQATANQIKGYQQKTGSIIYPAVVTRPDIAFAASQLAQHNRNPSPAHQDEVIRLIQYLYHTRHLGLEYCGRPGANELEAEEEEFMTTSDASFADLVDKKSSQGWLIQLFKGPIAWQASKQKSNTKSTTEAELLALSLAAGELIAIKRLFQQMRLVIDETPTLLCDNAQTVGIVNKDRPQLTTKLRHVDVHHFWLRQETQSGTMRVAWVPTNANAADGFTKNLGRAKHEEFRHNLNMRDTRDAQTIGHPPSN